MLSSRRALQISGTLVAGFEKSTFLRCLQVPFNILHSFSCKLVTNLIQLYDYILQLIEPFPQRVILWILSPGLVSLIFVKKGDMQSKVGSRSSLYSLMHNNFLFLQKCSSGGQNEKQRLSTLCQQRSASTSLSQSSVDRVGFIPILSSNDLSFTLSCFSERCLTSNFLVFLMTGMAWEQK